MAARQQAGDLVEVRRDDQLNVYPVQVWVFRDQFCSAHARPAGVSVSTHYPEAA
jgi:hypothetical protein